MTKIWTSMRLGAGAAQCRAAGRTGHAGVGHAADSEEAAQTGRARHGAHLRRAHERHELRRCVLHVAPESSSAARWRWCKTGDLIELDVPARRLESEGQRGGAGRSAARHGAAPKPKYQRGFGAIFQDNITQANEGCDFRFLEGTAPTAEPEIH